MQGIDGDDMYGGRLGLVWLCLRSFDFDPHRNMLQRAHQLLDQVAQAMKHETSNLSHHCSPITGSIGWSLLNVVLRSHWDDHRQALLDFTAHAERLSDNRNHPNEMLYGRSGLLYAIRCIQCRTCVPESIAVRLNALRQSLCMKIIQDGLVGAQQFTRELMDVIEDQPPLMWSWHRSYYLGAAHGVAGILHSMMSNMDVLSPADRTRIEQAVLWLARWVDGRGHVASSLPGSGKLLVQWCHGAPGTLMCLTKAARTFPIHRSLFLSKAEQCANGVVWTEGLLKKGVGLCHGVSGNVYAFLALFRETGNAVWLDRAMYMTSFIVRYPWHETDYVSDAPSSLFLGDAGVLMLYMDILDCSKSEVWRGGFPCFDDLE